MCTCAGVISGALLYIRDDFKEVDRETWMQVMLVGQNEMLSHSLVYLMCCESCPSLVGLGTMPNPCIGMC